MSCDGHRRRYWQQVSVPGSAVAGRLGGGDPARAAVVLEMVYRTARARAGRDLTSVAEGDHEALFADMEERGGRRPEHSPNSMEPASRRAYAELQRTLVALRSGDPPPALATEIESTQRLRGAVVNEVRTAWGHRRCNACGRWTGPSVPHICPMTVTAAALGEAVAAHTGVPFSAYGDRAWTTTVSLVRGHPRVLVPLRHVVTGEDVQVALDYVPEAAALGYVPSEWSGRGHFLRSSTGAPVAVRILPLGMRDLSEQSLGGEVGLELRHLAMTYGLNLPVEEEVDSAGSASLVSSRRSPTTPHPQPAAVTAAPRTVPVAAPPLGDPLETPPQDRLPDPLPMSDAARQRSLLRRLFQTPPDRRASLLATTRILVPTDTHVVPLGVVQVSEPSPVLVASAEIVAELGSSSLQEEGLNTSAQLLAIRMGLSGSGQAAFYDGLRASARSLYVPSLIGEVLPDILPLLVADQNASVAAAGLNRVLVRGQEIPARLSQMITDRLRDTWSNSNSGGLGLCPVCGRFLNTLVGCVDCPGIPTLEEFRFQGIERLGIYERVLSQLFVSNTPDVLFHAASFLPFLAQLNSNSTLINIVSGDLTSGGGNSIYEGLVNTYHRNPDLARRIWQLATTLRSASLHGRDIPLAPQRPGLAAMLPPLLDSDAGMRLISDGVSGSIAEFRLLEGLVPELVQRPTVVEDLWDRLDTHPMRATGLLLPGIRSGSMVLDAGLSRLVTGESGRTPAQLQLIADVIVRGADNPTGALQYLSLFDPLHPLAFANRPAYLDLVGRITPTLTNVMVGDSEFRQAAITMLQNTTAPNRSLLQLFRETTYLPEVRGLLLTTERRSRAWGELVRELLGTIAADGSQADTVGAGNRYWAVELLGTLAANGPSGTRSPNVPPSLRQSVPPVAAAPTPNAPGEPNEISIHYRSPTVQPDLPLTVPEPSSQRMAEIDAALPQSPNLSIQTMNVWRDLTDDERIWLCQRRSHLFPMAELAINDTVVDVAVAGLNLMSWERLPLRIPAGLSSRVVTRLVDGMLGRGQGAFAMCPQCGRFMNSTVGCLGCPGTLAPELAPTQDGVSDPLRSAVIPTLMRHYFSLIRSAVAPLIPIAQSMGLRNQLLDGFSNHMENGDLQIAMGKACVRDPFLWRCLFDRMLGGSYRNRSFASSAPAYSEFLNRLVQTPDGLALVLSTLGDHRIAARRVTGEALASVAEAPEVEAALYRTLGGDGVAWQQAQDLLVHYGTTHPTILDRGLILGSESLTTGTQRRRLERLYGAAVEIPSCAHHLLAYLVPTADETARRGWAWGVSMLRNALQPRVRADERLRNAAIAQLRQSVYPAAEAVQVLSQSLDQAGVTEVLDEVAERSRGWLNIVNSARFYWRTFQLQTNQATQAPVEAVQTAAVAVEATLREDHLSAQSIVATIGATTTDQSTSYMENFALFEIEYQAARSRVAAGLPPVPLMVDNPWPTPPIGVRGDLVGIELEFDGYGSMRQASNTLNFSGMLRENRSPVHGGALRRWVMRDDCTVSGGELVSRSLLVHDPQSWREVDEACKAIRESGGEATVRCGGHVHMDLAGYSSNPAYYERLVGLFRQGQDLIYRISTRPGAPQHRGGGWSRPLENGISSLNLRTFMDGHHSGLNFEGARSGTATDHVEFRSFDGSLDAGVIQAQVKWACALTKAALTLSDDAIRALPEVSLGSHHQSGVARESSRLEEDSRDFRVWLDALFVRDEDKAQLTALYAVTSWQDAALFARP